MISIICVYNKKKILDKYLIKSLKKQNYKNYELILVDNSNNEFDCAYSALNFGAKKATGDYFMFVHQDVDFLEKHTLKNISNYLDKIKNFGVLGVAGTKEKDIITNVVHGKEKNLAGNIQIDNYTECDCLDEVLFIIKKEVYDKYKFDKYNKTWHLYAADYCLNMKQNNYFVGIIPIKLYHASSGASFNDFYYVELKRLAKKYKKNFKMIRTTCGMWKTNLILLNNQIFIRKSKNKIKKMIGRYV